MTDLQATAVVALLILAFTTFLRAEMLRKSLDPNPDAERPTYSGNWPMIVGMDVVAGAAVGTAIELAMTGAPGVAAVMFVCACSVASIIILVSMIGHNWREAIRRREAETRADDVVQMREAVEETVPPVVERSLEKVTEEFRKPTPPYDALIRAEHQPPAK